MILSSDLDSDELHHCAIIWDYHGAHWHEEPRGALIPRQLLRDVIASIKSILPSASSEELCQLALSPRALMIDLATLIDPASDHAGRGFSEQKSAVCEMVWPSYQPAGEGLAFFKISLRPASYRDDLTAQESLALNQGIQARLASHFDALLGPNAVRWIGALDSRMMINGSYSHRQEQAEQADALGEAIILERSVKRSDARSSGPRI